MSSTDNNTREKKKKCVHDWIWLLPQSKEVDVADKVSYALDVMSARLADIKICTKCMCTGHVIKSRSSGIRVHYNSHRYFYDKAKQIADGYKIILPIDLNKHS